MNQMMKLALAAAVGLSLAGCAEEKPAEEPKTEEPKEEAKVEVPPYAPTGEHAELKKAGAEGVTVENAADQAKALEEELNKEIQTLEAPAPAGGEAAGGETK